MLLLSFLCFYSIKHIFQAAKVIIHSYIQKCDVKFNLLSTRNVTLMYFPPPVITNFKVID